jgi:ABC-type branched-subunit amino acid transport system ATPase component
LPEKATRPRRTAPVKARATTKRAPAKRAAQPEPEPERAPTLLKVTDLTSGYGALPVLHGISFEVGKGEIAVLLGLNGAGKSTTVQNLCGAVKPWSGAIEFDGQDASKWSVSQAVKAGVILVPEGRRVFPDLSV